MSKEEFLDCTNAEIVAYEKVYNEIEKRKDYRTAQISYILAEVNRDAKRNGKPFKIEDFMPMSNTVSKKRELKEKLLRFGDALRMIDAYKKR